MLRKMASSGGSWLKVMTALTMVTGGSGVAAVTAPVPEVNIERSIDGYALFVSDLIMPGVAEAKLVQTQTVKTTNPGGGVEYTQIWTEIVTEDEIRAAAEKEMKELTGVISKAQMVSLASLRIANNDLHKRMGDLRDHTADCGAWVRGYGGQGEVKGGLDYTMRAVQGGFDRVYPRADGKVIAGLTFLHTGADFDGGGTHGSGTGNFFGAYGSFVGSKGHYLDAIVKYGHMSTDFTAYDSAAMSYYSGRSGSNGINTSVEYGYRQMLKDGLYVEPQAELNYGRMQGDSYTMSNGAHVSTDAMDSFIGRVGVNLGKKHAKGSVYLTCSFLHEFMGDVSARVTKGGVQNSVTDSGRDTWLEYGIGFSQTIAERQNLYGELTRTAFADKISEKWRLNLGYRLSF